MKRKIDAKRFGPWAVVTGASSGIGREFACQLAAAGINVVLVARRLALLEDLGRELATKHGVICRSVQADLSEEGFLDIVRRVTDDLDIGLVVSNAGTGTPGQFLDHDRDELTRMVRLNALAHLDIAHHFGQRLSKRGRGGLLLCGAMGAQMGIPYMANVSGAKAYVQSLGESLHVELAKKGVTVTVLVVGPTQTPIIEKFGLDPATMPMKPMSAQQCVREGLDALQRNRASHLNGRINRIMDAVMPWSLARRMMGTMLAKAALATSVLAQPAVQANVTRIAADAQGTVSVSCALPGTPLNCDLRPHQHAPMQSVFKLPLAITVLHLADVGTLSLDHAVRFRPEDRMPGTQSPLQDRYPDANVDVSMRELIELSAGSGDNVATDMLLGIIGGPAVVESYMHSLGITAIQVQDGEHVLQTDPTAQYRNWIEPSTAVQLLERLANNSPLSSTANAFLMHALIASPTTPNRLRAGLPPGTVLAHKSGTSGEHHGKAEATNDIGLITLPDGRHLAVAVFVTDARADEATRDRVIAGIGRAVYDAALHARGEGEILGH